MPPLLQWTSGAPRTPAMAELKWRTFVLVVSGIGHNFQQNDGEDKAAWEVGLPVAPPAFSITGRNRG
jgi:hypothetical protein